MMPRTPPRVEEPSIGCALMAFVFAVVGCLGALLLYLLGLFAVFGWGLRVFRWAAGL